MSAIKLGFALTGSFCTFEDALNAMRACKAEGYDILPILSENAASKDTRFGKASDFIQRITEICGKPPITTIEGAEPIGPKNMTDILAVVPCTGNTLAKISNAITDTAVTMAVKSHLRGGKPVVIALSTNDALGATAQNLGKLLNRKHFYFLPMYQDNPVGKPTSMMPEFSRLPEALQNALSGRQLYPLFLNGAGKPD